MPPTDAPTINYARATPRPPRVGRLLLISAAAGIVLASLGLLLVFIGGWGPCGPASPTAALGGLLSVVHVVFLANWIPALNAANEPPLSIIILLAVPAADWTLCTFCLLFAATRAYHRIRHPRATATPNSK